jgi:predicted amidohydrolase YtcJ
VQQHNAEHRAVGGDQRQVDAQGGIQGGHGLLEEHLDELDQRGDDQDESQGLEELEMQGDEDIPRFAELGVIANFTPWWNASIPALNAPILGVERANNQLRCKTLWDTGALVTWSSDNVAYGDFTTWRPMLGMEVGMTRTITEKTVAPEYNRNGMVYPPADERMGIDEMLIGYTIRGARQLGIEDRKGSITEGKDADFLVFDQDLTTAEQAGFSYIEPSEVYFCGKKMN